MHKKYDKDNKCTKRLGSVLTKSQEITADLNQNLDWY